MTTPKSARASIVAILMFGSLAVTSPVWAQQHVVIDESVRAGALNCYRSIDNPLEYYYAINDVHLAQDESGKPSPDRPGSRNADRR